MSSLPTTVTVRISLRLLFRRRRNRTQNRPAILVQRLKVERVQSGHPERWTGTTAG